MPTVGALSPSIIVPFLTKMLKQNVIKIVGETANGTNYKLSRLEKFEVFCQVCDSLLAAGRISEAKHRQWTEMW